MQKKTWVPFLILMIFVLPMLTAWVCYHYYHYFQFKTTRHGTLIQPPLTLNAPTSHQWRLLLITEGPCEDECQQTLFSLQQMVKLLGKDRDRVLVEKITPAADKALRAFSWINGRIYLIDPIGNVFMYYAKGSNPLDILKDLKRLLEVSQIG